MLANLRLGVQHEIELGDYNSEGIARRLGRSIRRKLIGNTRGYITILDRSELEGVVGAGYAQPEGVQREINTSK